MSPRPDLPGILVHAIHRLHRNAVQTKLSAMGLEGVGSPMILMLLKRRGAEGGGAYQRELADALRISPAAIAMSLQSLERAGYVARREDPGDQRRKRVVITPRGAAAVEACRDALAAADAQMLAGFTAQERETLTALHLRMLDNLTPGDSPAGDPFERLGCNCSRP